MSSIFVRYHKKQVSSIAHTLPSRWRPGIRRRRVFHPETENLSRVFPFPPHNYTLVERVYQGNGSLSRTLLDACSTIPALIGMDDYGRFLSFRVRHQDIVRTYLNALIASVADIGIKHCHFVGLRYVRRHIDRFTHSAHLLFVQGQISQCPL